MRLHLPAEELQKLPLALQLSLDRMALPAGQLKIGDRVIGRGSLGIRQYAPKASIKEPSLDSGTNYRRS